MRWSVTYASPEPHSVVMKAKRSLAAADHRASHPPRDRARGADARRGQRRSGYARATASAVTVSAVRTPNMRSATRAIRPQWHAGQLAPDRRPSACMPRTPLLSGVGTRTVATRGAPGPALRPGRAAGDMRSDGRCEQGAGSQIPARLQVDSHGGPGWGGAWRQWLWAGPGLFRRTSVTFAQIDRSPSARATAMR